MGESIPQRMEFIPWAKKILMEEQHTKTCILEAPEPWTAPFAGAWTLFGDGTRAASALPAAGHGKASTQVLFPLEMI